MIIMNNPQTFIRAVSGAKPSSGCVSGVKRHDGESRPAIMKKVLLYYHGFQKYASGADYLALLLISELQKEYSVTVAVTAGTDAAGAAAQTGIPINAEKLNVVPLRRPKNSFLRKLDDLHLPIWRTGHLKRMAKDADLCISASSIFDFGRPGHYFICSVDMHDSAFREFTMHAPPPSKWKRFRRRFTSFLSDAMIRPLSGVRSTRKILSDPREYVYPNSHYVEKLMLDFYGPFTETVFYPPTLFEPEIKDVKRDPLRVVCLGRIAPEKHVEDIIAIVERARELSGMDLQLQIAGQMKPASYEETIRRTAEKKPWICFPGPLFGEDKERFLLSGSFAVHILRYEAFGISITEYLKAGIVPIVPDEGGTTEVVDSPQLTYHTSEEAAAILARLARDKAFLEEQRTFCRKRAGRFSRETYLENQKKLLLRILSAAPSPGDNQERTS